MTFFFFFFCCLTIKIICLQGQSLFLTIHRHWSIRALSDLRKNRGTTEHTVHSFNPPGTVMLLLFFVHKIILIFKNIHQSKLNSSDGQFVWKCFHILNNWNPTSWKLFFFLYSSQRAKGAPRELHRVLYSIWEAHQPSTETKLFKVMVNKDVNVWKAESTGKELFFKVLCNMAFC